MGKLVWHGPAEKKRIMEGMWRNLSAASIYLASEVKKDISQPGTLRYTVPSKGKKAKRPKQKTIYNFSHSLPGNPPYKQTGRLRGSITWELAGAWRNRGRVGTNVKYGLYLSKGTKRGLKPRPFLETMLERRRAILAAILNRRIKAGQLPRSSANQYRSGRLGAGAAKAGF